MPPAPWNTPPQISLIIWLSIIIVYTLTVITINTSGPYSFGTPWNWEKTNKCGHRGAHVTHTATTSKKATSSKNKSRTCYHPTCLVCLVYLGVECVHFIYYFELRRVSVQLLYYTAAANPTELAHARAEQRTAPGATGSISYLYLLYEVYTST